MPILTIVADDDAEPSRDPGFECTDLRHTFLSAVATTPDTWFGPYMTLEDLGELEFAEATTTPFGDRLNEFGAVLLERWSIEHPAG